MIKMFTWWMERLTNEATEIDQQWTRCEKNKCVRKGKTWWSYRKAESIGNKC